LALATGTEAMKPSGLPCVVIDTWATNLPACAIGTITNG
jgi:hypothetical protein